MPTSDQRVAALKLRFEIEKSAANQAIKFASSLKNELNAIAQAEKAITPEAAKSGAAVARANDQARKSAIAAAKETKALNDQIKQTGFLSKETQDQLRTIRTEGRAESFATRTVANVLPGDIGGAANQVFDLIDTIPELSTAFTVLKASMMDTLAAIGGGSALAGGGIVLGVAALAGGLALLSRQNDEAIDKLNKRIEKEYEYNNITARLTQDQIRDQIAAKQKEIDVARANLEDTRRISSEAINDVLTNSSAIELGIRGVLNIFKPDEATEAAKKYTDAQAALNDLTADMADLEKALSDTDVVTRSLVAAQDKFVNENIRVLQQAQTMTGDQANARIKAINDEIAAIERYINVAGQSEENRAVLQERIDQLRLEGSLLQTLIPTVIAYNDALAYEAKQRQDTIAAVKKFNEDMSAINRQARDAETAAHEKYADTVVAISERAAEAAESALRKLKEKQADLARDLGRDFEDIEIARERERVDLQVKFADEEAKAARQHATEMQRIRRQGQRDELNAIAERDAVALDNAQTRTRDQLRDETDRYQEEARERAIAFANETRDQRTQYERQRQDALTAYSRNLQDAALQYERERQLAEQNRIAALARAAQEYEAERAQIAQKFATERTLRQQAITAELNLINMGYQQRARVQAQYENALVAQSQRILGQLSAYSGYGSTHTNAQDTGHVIGFAGGGSPPMNRSVMVGERGPELVRFKSPAHIYSANQTRQMGGSMTINLQGATTKTIQAMSRQEAIAAVEVALDEMGAF